MPRINKLPKEPTRKQIHDWLRAVRRDAREAIAAIADSRTSDFASSIKFDLHTIAGDITEEIGDEAEGEGG